LAVSTPVSVEFEIAPRRAGTNLVGVSVDFTLTIRNIGQVPARAVRLEVYLLTAGEQQQAQLEALFDGPVDRPIVTPFDLPAAGDTEVSAVTTVPFADANQVQLLGRPIVVPIVVAVARYDWGEGGEGRLARAFVLGVKREGSDRLAPFWLDRGPRMFDAVGWRPHSDGRHG